MVDVEGLELVTIPASIAARKWEDREGSARHGKKLTLLRSFKISLNGNSNNFIIFNVLLIII